MAAKDRAMRAVSDGTIDQNPRQSNQCLSIVEQHAESAAFLWSLRSSALTDPKYDVASLVRLDERLEGHVDGLRVATESAAWGSLVQLGLGSGGVAFVGAVLASESGDRIRFRQVLDVSREDLDIARGTASGLGWIAFDTARPLAIELCRSKIPLERRIGVAMFALHRQDPGADLERWLDDSSSIVRARAARAAGELGRVDAMARLHPHLGDADRDCSFWCAWAAALLGSDEAVPVLQDIAMISGPHRERAADLAARRLGPDPAGAWQTELARNIPISWLALRFAAAHGDPTSIPWLIEQMTIPHLSRVAGEAFTSITGADLAYLDLDGNKPEGFESGPNDDPDDENVDMDPDENLPFPNVERVRAWWAREGHRFAPGTRYLLGLPITIENAKRVLREGKQRQRAAAALELAMARPGTVLFEVRERADRQLARLRE